MEGSHGSRVHEQGKKRVMRVFINRVTVTGYLTRDPELQCLPSGASVCNLSIGCNDRRRDRQTGEWYEKPNFFDVVVFGGQGEAVARFMRKGKPIAVDGKLDWRSWETKDGRRAHDLSIIAEHVQFLGDPPREPSDPNPQRGETSETSEPGPEAQRAAPSEDDELDFDLLGSNLAETSH